MRAKMLILEISMAKTSKFFIVFGGFGGHLGCKVSSWGLWERLLMSGGSKLEAFGLQNEVPGAFWRGF